MTDDISDSDSEPEIDKALLVRKLNAYMAKTKALLDARAYNRDLVLEQIAVATELQELVGDDVVIFYMGRSFVPTENGYQILPVYDLDAALIHDLMFEDGAR